MDMREIKASLERIYLACSEPLYDVLEGIPQDQLYWKPASESRSIGEMVRHLIRVDNWFLERLGYAVEVSDPGNVSAEELLATLKKVHQQVQTILSQINQESELSRKVQAQDAGEHDSLVEIFVHMAQHNLYHLAQMIYLRRARDRSWQSPIQKWEKATYVLSDELWFVRALLGKN